MTRFVLKLPGFSRPLWVIFRGSCCRRQFESIGRKSVFARAIAAATLVALATACAPSFSVKPIGVAHFTPTEAVEIISTEPPHPYVVVATFAGQEEGRCPAEKPYCSLRTQAERIGAHAVWIQKRDTHVYPGEWVQIQGQLTQIRGFTVERIEGVLIRYAE